MTERDWEKQAKELVRRLRRNAGYYKSMEARMPAKDDEAAATTIERLLDEIKRLRIIRP